MAANAPAVITGCQRSGTTLLHLILDSHPQVRGVDEADFAAEKLPVYLEDPGFGPQVCFKLPPAAADLAFVAGLPGVRVLWCLRDPRDVVASMLRLRIPLNRFVALPWVDHPGGAEVEIGRAAAALGARLDPALRAASAEAGAVLRKRAATRSRGERVLLAALCWRLKNELLSLYRERELPLHPVGYEGLLADPAGVVAGILDFLGLAWHDDVLAHHRLHAGVGTGGTRGDRPIDPTNTGRWRGELEPPDLVRVAELCGALAGRLGYAL